MKCNWKDCFTCPYPDCINDYVYPYNAESNKKYYQANKEKRKQQVRNYQKERIANGLCEDCGKRPIAKNSKSRCTECLLRRRIQAEERRRKNGVLPRTLFDGVTRCLRCGNEELVSGHKLCEKCLETSRKSVESMSAFANRETMREQINLMWSNKMTERKLEKNIL